MIKEIKRVNKKKYKFFRYSSKYPILFAKEKLRIKNALRRISSLRIEHVGSSSVPGLGGKGIIDIAVSVPKPKIKEAIRLLSDIRFKNIPGSGQEGRIFLQKVVKYKGKERRVHIQLTHTNSIRWRAMVGVRNILRENEELRKRYAEIKKRAVKYAKGEGRRYREYKDSFLKEIEKKAMNCYKF